jgi:perosamine synthetase
MWIPRGRLYHTLMQSVKYLSWTLGLKLELKQLLLLNLERKFADYLGVKYCRIFPSARIALYFSLKALNLPSGSKILMPPITIKPMLDVIYDLNLEPIFVDLDKDNFAFDLDDLEGKITSDTRVMFLTYLFGHVPDMNRTKKIVEKNSLILIEDFSQAIGASFQGMKVGSFGSISIYSSSSIKTLDTLGGGFAVTNDINLDSSLFQGQNQLSPPKRRILVKKAFSNLIRNIGTQKFIFSLITINFLKVLRRINKTSANRMTGTRSPSPLGELPEDWFCGYSYVQYKIAIEQMKELNKKLNLRVKNASDILEQSVTDVGTQPSVNVYWQLCLMNSNIENVFRSAERNKIDISQTSLSLISENDLYPNHLECPNAKEIYFKSFFVPCYPQLTRTDLDKLQSWLRSIE